MSNYEVHIGQSVAPNTRWYIVIHPVDEPKCSLYSTGPGDGEFGYEHEDLPDGDFDDPSIAKTRIATVPANKLRGFEARCLLGVIPGPSQPYVVRTLYKMHEGGYIDYTVVEKYKKLASYSDEERQTRNGFYVQQDQEEYEYLEEKRRKNSMRVARR
ncbi:hypothetical protein BDW62DRAFT_197055 [Aspergillus aurantiobrunneus]